jgi:hypothetical protein
MTSSSLICPKCKSTDITVQAIADTHTKNHSVFWWIYFLLIGWVVEVLMWLFATLPMLLIRIFHHRGVETTVQKVAICQQCGHQWKVRGN